MSITVYAQIMKGYFKLREQREIAHGSARVRSFKDYQVPYVELITPL
jgi:hypothetical protein